MCTSRKENIGQIEIMIRFYIAIFFIVLAIHYDEYLILVLPIIIIYTAIKRNCFVYSVFGINQHINSQQYYKSLLLLNNPSPVFIFDDEGKILFKNEQAKGQLNHIIDKDDLKIPEKFLDYHLTTDDIEFSFIYEYKEKTYSLHLKYLIKEKFIFAYFTDITDVIQLNDEM
jgi:c-di-AMP phosphodiesterase-like protein